MPAKDLYHDKLKHALQKEGWTVTHDPYYLALGRKKGFIDLGAELIVAQKDTNLIAIEIKSFIGFSDLDEFKNALGQYLIYEFALATKEPERELFLAIPETIYNNFLDDTFFIGILVLYHIRMIVFDENTATIKLWKRY